MDKYNTLEEYLEKKCNDSNNYLNKIKIGKTLNSQVPIIQKNYKASFESKHKRNSHKFQKKYQDEVTNRLMKNTENKVSGYTEVQKLLNSQESNVQNNRQFTRELNINKNQKEVYINNFNQNQEKYEIDRIRKLAKLANDLQKEEVSSIKNPKINKKSK